ncbi:helix-turn-helix domain-containing protein [Chenggangzhangella methanolivorans]|uniref:Helix-turn-helix domain-containing protein n=1 Tax=Chenggangzhangella methanolivorans TaxID=1437009 RepID=A0A9E6RBN6_9HYPH|nr:AraC family transcriptional regulator [Chenggangzhangella methanolivorans]QZO00900.1 helix-turn-helix domain-containing protein [Chenggangzhangella methanolivorans]
MTRRVEGVTRSDDHLLLVTLSGGAKRLTVVADDGHRYDGPDRAGAVSFLPAFCERRLTLDHVEAEWASISLSRASFGPLETAARLAPFSNVEDPVVFAIVGEIDRMHRADGAVDAAYAETMAFALARHVARRAGVSAERAGRTPALPRWKLKRVRDHVEAHLDRQISIAELAEVAGMSAGHFHRAFREATGATPLRFIQERRVELAARLLRTGEASVGEVAAKVGFESQSHFARVFRAIAGRRPSEAGGG